MMRQPPTGDEDYPMVTAEEGVRRALHLTEEVRTVLEGGTGPLEPRSFANALDRYGWTIVPKAWITRIEVFGAVAIVREEDGAYHLLSSAKWRIVRTEEEG